MTKGTGYLLVFAVLSFPWIYMWEFKEKSETMWEGILLEKQIPVFLGPITLLTSFNVLCTRLNIYSSSQKNVDDDYHRIIN